MITNLYYRVLLKKLCLRIFKNYTKIKIGKEHIRLTFFYDIFNIFGKKFNLIDFLYYEIPKQISLSSWNSLDRVKDIQTTLQSYNTEDISEKTIENWIEYLNTSSIHLHFEKSKQIVPVTSATNIQNKVELELYINKILQFYNITQIYAVQKLRPVYITSSLWLFLTISNLKTFGLLTTKFGLLHSPLKSLVELKIDPISPFFY